MKVPINTLVSLSILFLQSFSVAQQDYNQDSITPDKTDTSLDSLYDLFIDIKSNNDMMPHEIQSPIKCGLDIITQIKLNFDSYNGKQREILKKLLYRPPEMQKSIVSPSGFFRVHFDTTNSNGNGIPSYVPGWSIDQNVAEVAKALDSAYNFEVNYIGFLPPPGDDTAGGDFRYDIYIINQSSQIYGYTEWEDKVGPVNWTSFIVVDNDYAGYYTTGINGLRITAAHEFHHAIQIGSYSVLNGNSPIRINDIFFYELSSTSMEEFVYDDVNDYYAYMYSYFNDPGKAFPLQNGYNLCIWNLYLKEIFGYDIIKSQWEMIPNLEAILAIDSSITLRNSSLKKELNNFGIWTYFTGSRAIPGIYFEEASNYPLIAITSTIVFNPPSTVLIGQVHPTTNTFYKFNLPSGGGFIVTIVTNGDANEANLNPNQYFQFLYTMFNYNEVGSELIANNYYYTFGSQFEDQFAIGHIFNDIAGTDGEFATQNYQLSQNYPNPFNPSTVISYRLPVIGFVTLKVYDVLGREVATLVNEEKSAGEYEIEFNGSKLPSGIYFYQLKTGNFVETKKMVLLK